MLDRIKLRTQNLKIGMYICALDRPWIETPFSLQGVWIRSPDDIETVSLYCDFVYVDPNKSWIKLTATNEKPSAKMPRTSRRQTEPQTEQKKEKKGLLVPIGDEIDHARSAYNHASSLFGSIIQDIKKNKPINVGEIQQTLLKIIDSLQRNSDALIWLSLLKDKDKYTYQHSLNVSIHMLNFGKHLKLPKQQLLQIGLCGLLQDIGKIKVPDDVLHKAGNLSAKEKQIVMKHVQYSGELLNKTPGIDAQVLTAISQHHEKHDGSGYPNGLRENQIGTFGAMAAITDCYDAMISMRPGASAISSFGAVGQLHKLKGKSFHPALVERFIQCIGVYSAGSLVELNQGDIGIVIEQSRARRLKPKVLIIYDKNKEPYKTPFVVDLLLDAETPEDISYYITNVLEPGTYNIDSTDYYL